MAGMDTLFDSLPRHRPWYCYGSRSLTILWKRNRASRWPFRLRMAWQRARHGFSDDQFWSLNHALATLTVRGVKRLRDWKHGYPSEFSPEFGGGGWEQWDGILARIEVGFQAYMDEDGWFHGKPDAEEKFKDAMALYAEWFGALWD